MVVHGQLTMLRHLGVNRQSPLRAQVVIVSSRGAQFNLCVGDGRLCGDQLRDGDETPDGEENDGGHQRQKPKQSDGPGEPVEDRVELARGCAQAGGQCEAGEDDGAV